MTSLTPPEIDDQSRELLPEMRHRMIEDLEQFLASGLEERNDGVLVRLPVVARGTGWKPVPRAGEPAVR